MVDPNKLGGNSADGVRVPPGGGYVPPGGAAILSGLSGGSSGVAVASAGAGLMTLAWSMDVAGGPAQGYGRVGDVINLPLVTCLMLAAVVFAGLALLVTALTGRNNVEGYVVRTPLALLRSYAVLTLLGLASDGLALDFLARRALGSVHLAAVVGTLLEIVAFAVGIYSLLPSWRQGGRARA
jgi:hypothetical protein